MRLGVDARELIADTRGIGRYERAIVARLAARHDVDLRLILPGMFPITQRRAIARLIGSERFSIARSARGCDVVWHPANGMFVPFKGSNVATIHDLAPFRFPHADARRRAAQQEPFLRSAHRAAHIIAVSQAAKEDLVSTLHIEPQRISVIYHGIDDGFSPERQADDVLPTHLRRPYFLFVGDPHSDARKNFAVLLEGYRRAFPPGDCPALVVVAQLDPQIEGVVHAAGAGIDARGEQMLRVLYRNALAVCVPSTYEGFGLPVIEAMASGAPVIASRASCLPEVGGDAAVYAEPHDPREWAQQLVRMAGDEPWRAFLRNAGLLRANEFRWDRSAQMHVEVFASL